MDGADGNGTLKHTWPAAKATCNQAKGVGEAEIKTAK